MIACRPKVMLSYLKAIRVCVHAGETGTMVIRRGTITWSLASTSFLNQCHFSCRRRPLITGRLKLKLMRIFYKHRITTVKPFCLNTSRCLRGHRSNLRMFSEARRDLRLLLIKELPAHIDCGQFYSDWTRWHNLELLTLPLFVDFGDILAI